MSARARRFAAVSAWLLLAAACQEERPARPVETVQDFEASPAITRWPREAPGKAAISTAWAADGTRSLQIDAGVMAAFKQLRFSDWTGYSVLRFQVHNPGDRTAGIDLEIQDQHPAFDERHQQSFGVPPGDHAIELDFSGGMWRGEENRPYRGALKTPIDVSHVTRIAFTNRGDGPLYVDRLEIARVPPLAVPGGFAFDFGVTGKQVMGQTQGVFEDTFYAPERGFGMLGGVPAHLGRAMSYPTPLLGDGLGLEDGGFRVDLPGGDYLGWIAFERGGFWEGEQSGYEHADLRINGEAVTGHDFSGSGAHFFFEDTEVTDLGQIEERLVRPAHAVSRFHFRAARGANVFTLAVTSAVGEKLRVAGLVIAPDTPEGSAFIEAHERRQRDAIALAYPSQDRGRRKGRAPPARDLVVEALPVGSQVYPRDLPEHAEGALPGEILAVPGQPATVQLGVHARRELAIQVASRSLAGPEGATLSAPAISYGRYLPMRPLGGGPVWLEINHYRPEPSFVVSPDVARSLLIEIDVPTGASPGVYAGSVVLGAGEASVEVPLRVRVIPAALPEIPIPVGLLMNALPFGPEAVGEDRWWTLQEALLDEQSRAGLNVITGGAGLDFQASESDGAITFAGDRALSYVETARVRSMARAVVPYGGFFGRLSDDWVDPVAFAGAWRAFDAAHRLPPFLFNAYDEPGTPDEIERAIASTGPFTRAGIATLGFTSMRHGDARFARLLDATTAPALHGHEAADLGRLTGLGKHPWLYNQGMDRRSMGLGLWKQIRAGAAGRLEWIGVITQGFAFDNLDGREPSPCSWLVHDRLGLLPTPRWLAAREGLLDLRIRLALERAVPPGDPALGAWPAEGYAVDEARWTDAALAAARAAMLERLAAGSLDSTR